MDKIENFNQFGVSLGYKRVKRLGDKLETFSKTIDWTLFEKFFLKEGRILEILKELVRRPGGVGTGWADHVVLRPCLVPVPFVGDFPASSVTTQGGLPPAFVFETPAFAVDLPAMGALQLGFTVFLYDLRLEVDLPLDVKVAFDNLGR